MTATRLVGEIAKARGVRRFIFASSCSVYGACDEIVDERAHFNPQSLYARSKVASEAVLGALNSNEFAVTCLRFATIYGISGRTRFDLVVNLLCAKAVRDGIITVFGDRPMATLHTRRGRRRAVVMTLQAPIDLVAGEGFNVGDDAQNYTLGDVAKHINQQVPDARSFPIDTSSTGATTASPSERSDSRLGFRPAWTLEQRHSAGRSARALPTRSAITLCRPTATFSIEGARYQELRQLQDHRLGKRAHEHRSHRLRNDDEPIGC